jgi:protein ImuA
MPRISHFFPAEPQSRRRPQRGVAAPVALSEVFAGGRADGAAMGFVLSRLPEGPGPVLWIQDRMTRLECGQPYQPAMGHALLRLDLPRPGDGLIAAEEGLQCATLAAVVVELWGDPPALGFTATKRLALRAEASGVPCWLIRHGGTADLSAARDRWRVTSLPSALHPDDGRAPGGARWAVELFRSRDKAPGHWVVDHEGGWQRAADRVDLPAGIRDGTLAAPAGGALRQLAR